MAVAFQWQVPGVCCMAPSNLHQQSPTSTASDAFGDAAFRSCEKLGHALNGGIAETVEEVQKLILRYYDNVREQAAESFASAKRVALIGFALLIVTIGYVIAVDLLLHLPGSGFQ